MKNNKEMNCIKLNIYFHTNNMEFGPKVALPKGAVYMPTNHKHGIRASDVDKRFFFGPTQGTIMDAIKNCLNTNSIKIIKEEMAIEYKKLKKMEKSGVIFNDELKI